MYDDPLDEATQGLREHEARRIVEAVVMAATDPVEAGFLAQLVELPVARIEELCRELADEYEASGRGFVLVKVAGGYRYQTHADLSAYIERFVLEGQHARLSAPRSRRSRSSPTSSRSRVRRSPPSAAWMSSRC